MLLQTPKLDADDLRVLGEIDQMRADLQLQVRARPHWTGQLRRQLTAAAIQGSNTIEKITIGMSDARAVVEGLPMSVDVTDETQLAIRGYRDALTYVQQVPHIADFEYHRTLLSALHFMITKYNMSKWPGRYRAGGIFVTGSDPLRPVYTGPDPELVPELMDELIDWLNAGDLDQPSLVRAAMAHLNLVSIHPWRDGNGRMSRCLHTLVLARDGVLAAEFSSIEEWLGHEINTLAYYQALQSRGEMFRPEADCHTWLRFVLSAHHQQAQTVQARVDYTVVLWRALEAVAAERGLPERTVSALYSAALGELRRATYQGDEELSRDQAIRDVQALVRNGLVKAKGNAVTRVYLIDGVARDAHLAAMDAVRKPMREPYRR
ncbi:Fic family protein [Catellatospora methionotrophica]|uniref:Fic family protein n=1 Tax=Catellatospora methionotrophica TaxID=121620 RepID=UPI00140AC6C7|nr:Fic family protein [Catellatospora methionotrophica]